MRTPQSALAALTFVVFVASACRVETTSPRSTASPPTQAAAVGEVTVGRVAGGVRIANGTDRAVAYAVWNEGWLALFAPCTESGAACPTLAPGASVVVADGEIAGAAPGMTSAIVRWWHVVPDGAGGRRAEDLREVVVRL